jgi:hypothetical protein
MMASEVPNAAAVVLSSINKLNWAAKEAGKK